MAATKIQAALRGFLARRYTRVMRAENQATLMLLSVTAAKRRARQEVVAADTNAVSDPILPPPSIRHFSKSVHGRSARRTARVVVVRDQRNAAASFCHMAPTRCERSSKPACHPPRARLRSRPVCCSGDKATTCRRLPKAHLRSRQGLLMQCLGAWCMRHTDLPENVSADTGVADAAGHHSYAHQLHVLVKNNQIGRQVKGLFLGIGLDRRVVAHGLHCSSRMSCLKRRE